jgi:SAM-dependent methyltransferase
MIANRIRYLWYLVVGASAIPAMRLGREWWEDDYARERLARTEGEAELPRHLLVAGLVRHYAPGGTILDIGCGTGGLTVPLRAAFAGAALDYVGLDLSSTALEQAAARRDEADGSRGQTGNVQFVQADFDEYAPDRTFDAIIFSESLYYAADPLRTIRRYTSALDDGGAIIVSMWRRPSRQRVWRVLRDELRERSRIRLSVPRRPAWDIAVFTTD